MTIDITAIKARAEKATGAFITCVSGDGKPYVKFQFKELKAAQSFYAAVFDGRTDIPAIIAAIEASEAARVKAEQERDSYRAKLMQLADATEVSGLSWSGFNILGDKKSIKAVQSAVHFAGQIEEYRAAFADRLKQVEQERDALKEALTNSCDLLESYIDTFGDMSGANREDLNDYRAVLTAYDKRGK